MKNCVICGKRMGNYDKSNRLTCSTGCRQKRYRQVKQIERHVHKVTNELYQIVKLLELRPDLKDSTLEKFGDIATLIYQIIEV